MSKTYYRKVIHICAEDSPNVKLALRERALGLDPSGRIIVHGVLPWQDYVKRRTYWDPIRQCIGLDGKFYKGAELMLFPPTWLDYSELLDKTLQGARRIAAGMGIDPGEGGANTAISVVDRHGLLELWSQPTPDTNVIHLKVIEMMNKWALMPERVVFDRGGGGKQIADRMRAMGIGVRTVAFGESVSPDPRRIVPGVAQRVEEKEERYVFFNRRAQMYGELSEMMDPNAENQGFAIPPAYFQIRRQLAMIPKTFDGEGRLFLLPKHKKDPNSKQPTLTELIGHSPDEADSLVLALHAVLHEKKLPRAGAMRGY